MIIISHFLSLVKVIKLYCIVRNGNNISSYWKCSLIKAAWVLSEFSKFHPHPNRKELVGLKECGIDAFGSDVPCN